LIVIWNILFFQRGYANKVHHTFTFLMTESVIFAISFVPQAKLTLQVITVIMVNTLLILDISNIAQRQIIQRNNHTNTHY